MKTVTGRKVLEVKDGKRRVAVTISPGDELPAGVYLNGWKLDAGQYGPGKMHLIVEEEA